MRYSIQSIKHTSDLISVFFLQTKRFHLIGQAIESFQYGFNAIPALQQMHPLYMEKIRREFSNNLNICDFNQYRWPSSSQGIQYSFILIGRGVGIKGRKQILKPRSIPRCWLRFLAYFTPQITKSIDDSSDGVLEFTSLRNIRCEEEITQVSNCIS